MKRRELDAIIDPCRAVLTRELRIGPREVDPNDIDALDECFTTVAMEQLLGRLVIWLGTRGVTIEGPRYGVDRWTSCRMSTRPDGRDVNSCYCVGRSAIECAVLAFEAVVSEKGAS